MEVAAYAVYTVYNSVTASTAYAADTVKTMFEQKGYFAYTYNI